MYLEKLNEFFLHHPMCTLDVACECVRAWDLCLGMEHGKDLMELLIVDEGVWPVLADHPMQEAPMQTFMRISTSSSKLLHDLGLFR